LGAVGHPEFGQHFQVQREGFFDAVAFQRYYRDSTEPEVLVNFEKDVFHGVFDTHSTSHADTMAKIAAVMSEAKSVQVSGVLQKYARVPVNRSREVSV
jgi:hypothetical protein